MKKKKENSHYIHLCFSAEDKYLELMEVVTEKFHFTQENSKKPVEHKSVLNKNLFLVC